VWEALTNPAIIKKYMYGTNTKSDWKKGSPITYSGEWQGKPYEDKGVIKEIIPEKVLHTTYYSPLSGKDDKPENYANVIYELEPMDAKKTKLTISQDNIDNEAGVATSEKNWGMVIDGMKKVVGK
jgi:uncharacterized protein YndB with AHSA1/START domain